jgi:hypothetical protein
LTKIAVSTNAQAGPYLVTDGSNIFLSYNLGGGSNISALAIPNPLYTNTTVTFYIWTNAATGGSLQHIPGFGLVYTNAITGSASLISGTNGGMHIGGTSMAGPGNLWVSNKIYFESQIIGTNGAGGSNVMSSAGGAAQSGILSNYGGIKAIGFLYNRDFTLFSTAAKAEAADFLFRAIAISGGIGGANSGIVMGRSYAIRWTTGTGNGVDGGNGGTADIGIAGPTPGLLEVNNGTAGIYRDLIARNGVFTNTATATNGFIIPSATGNISFIGVNQSNAPTTGATTAYLYAATNGGTAEIFAKDGAGNVTQISPHAFDGPTSLYDATDDMPMVSRDVNVYTGKARWINQSREARRVEQLSWAVKILAGLAVTNGMSASQINKIQTVMAWVQADIDIISVTTNWVAPVSWTSVQTNLLVTYQNSYTNAVVAYAAAVAGGNTNAVAPVWGPPAVQPIPASLSSRGVN